MAQKSTFNATCEVRDMKQLPFSVFKKGQRRFYYVRFKDEQTGKYLPVISTKTVNWKDEHSRLTNILAMVTGMRAEKYRAYGFKI